MPCVADLDSSDQDFRPTGYGRSIDEFSETAGGMDPIQAQINTSPLGASEARPGADPGMDQPSRVTALILVSVVIAVVIAFLLSKYRF